MNPQKIIRQLDRKQMINCEVCHGLHTLEESEMVVINIIKGKNCDINQVVKPKAFTPAPIGSDLTTPPPPVIPRKPIVPPQFLGVMIPPGDANFETQGAKEKRVI
jgi:hypothetical protein